MKANQAFRNADEAVSPVIGVILMVAITVVLAAVVFVLVSNLSKTSDKADDVAINVSSPRVGALTLQMVKAGPNAPYRLCTTNAGACVASPGDANFNTANDARITIDDKTCYYQDNTGTTGPFYSSSGNSGLTGGATVVGTWGAGQILTFTKDCTSNVGTQFVSGSEHSVTVTIRGTVVFTDAHVQVR